MKSTKQRAAVIAALLEIEDFRSAQQLHDLLRQQGNQIGLTTVYRTLQALAELGEVDVIVRDDGESVYRQCSDSHHHHLVCRTCGSTVEVEGPEVEKWAHSVAETHGFVEVTHTLEIFGLCRDCHS